MNKKMKSDWKAENKDSLLLFGVALTALLLTVIIHVIAGFMQIDSKSFPFVLVHGAFISIYYVEATSLSKSNHPRANRVLLVVASLGYAALLMFLAWIFWGAIRS